jgi:hypothetical protein
MRIVFTEKSKVATARQALMFAVIVEFTFAPQGNVITNSTGQGALQSSLEVFEKSKLNFK